MDNKTVSENGTVFMLKKEFSLFYVNALTCVA